MVITAKKLTVLVLSILIALSIIEAFFLSVPSIVGAQDVSIKPEVMTKASTADARARHPRTVKIESSVQLLNCHKLVDQKHTKIVVCTHN